MVSNYGSEMAQLGVRRERKHDSVLEVGARERRGKAWIDHRRPFGATAKLVETAHFSRVRPDLYLPSQSEKSADAVVRKEPDVFRGDQRGPERKKPTNRNSWASW